MKLTSSLRLTVLSVCAVSISCARDPMTSEPKALISASLAKSESGVEFTEWSDARPVDEVNSLPDATTPASLAADNTPYLSGDGLSLYFGSTRRGGIGSTDIWVAHRSSTDAPWGTPHNLGTQINTAAIEVGPSLAADGLLLFFSSSRPSSEDEVGVCGGGAVATPTRPHCDNDIWVSRRACNDDACPWGTPVNLGPEVNTDLFEGGQAVWGAELFFNRGSTANAVAGAPNPGSPADIFVSRIDVERITSVGVAPGGLTPAVLLPTVNDRDSVDQRPSIAASGQEMYLTSNRLGTPDIWVATRQGFGVSWGEPTRLTWSTFVPGTAGSINTQFQELHPSISADGTTLFFASNRRGSADIFVATRERLR